MNDNTHPPAIPSAAKPHSRKPWVTLAIWAIAAVALFYACTSINSGNKADRAAALATKFHQTWSKSYGDTTCADWNSRMTAQQQFAASADILAAAWAKIEKSDRFPSDDLITDFQSGITTACVIRDASITDIAAGVYLTEAVFKP